MRCAAGSSVCTARIERDTQTAGGGAVLSAHHRRTRGVTSQMPLTAAQHLLPCPCSTVRGLPQPLKRCSADSS
eukprot:COSAG01_NODE_6635_length_3568_cov_8.046411_2_plen_73_part_00